MIASQRNAECLEPNFDPPHGEENSFSNEYFVKDPQGQEVGIQLISLYYGTLWKRVLDRLRHKLDGHLFTLHHEGAQFNVYRNLNFSEAADSSHLRLIC